MELGNHAIINLLFAHGADVAQPNEHRQTPISLASKNLIDFLGLRKCLVGKYTEHDVENNYELTAA